MRVMVIIKGRGQDEGKAAPTPEMFEAMNAYNEALVDARIMVSGEGLHPTEKGTRILFDADGTTSVVNGPFPQSEEVIYGYWLWEVDNMAQAIDWARKCPPDPTPMSQQLEIRPLFEMDDLGDELPPEVLEREKRLMERMKAQRDS